MNGAEVLTRFTADTSGVDKAVKGTSASLGKLTTAFTLGNVAASAINKAFQAMSQNMDSAIKRYDTMNNFPKVMQNLGISGDEANEVIKSLSEELKGLPTSLDAGARAVQRFTTVNGNIKESEKLFVAVNNAILAGGASADIQSSAIEQFSQAFSKGKPDMMEWRTLLMAMPAQLKQVATSMGMTTDQLGEGLRNGKISMTQFTDEIVKLNKTGVGEFASFEEQAKTSTGGISTSITNMKTAMARGVADMIGKVNTALEPFGGLSGVITTVGQVAEKVFGAIGNAIAWVIPIVVNVVNFFKEYSWVLAPLAGIIAGIVAALTTYKTIMTVINTIQAIHNALLLANPAILIISLIIGAIAGLVAGIMWLWDNCAWFRDGVLGAINFIKSAIQVAIDFITNLLTTLWNFISPVVDFVKNLFLLVIAVITIAIEKIMNVIIPIVSWIWDNVLSPIFSVVGDIFGKIWGVISGIIEKIIGAFKTVGSAISSVFKGAQKIISNIFKTIANIVKAPINFIIDGINMFIKFLNKIKIPDWVPGVGGKGLNFKLIPKLATGTNYVPEDTLAMIHKGEAVVPKKFNPYANGVSPKTIGNMNYTKPTTTVIVNAEFETDPLGQMVQKIKTFSGGAKNDYNYGMGVR